MNVVHVKLCPKCGSDQIMVIDSRDTSYGRKRRRKCITCNYRYSSIEVITDEDDLPLHVKEYKEFMIKLHALSQSYLDTIKNGETL